MSRNLDQFITKSAERLGPYYSGVAPFLARLPKNSDRDDIDLLSEPPESYVGNMLALGILNRLYQKEFAQTTHRVLVLPECVKDYAEWECSKTELDNHSECIQCQPECQINISVDLYADDRTDLLMEPDDTERMAREYREQRGTVGVVGVACVLTLISGFKNTLKHGHPTQGVLLNYSSCKHHWTDKPYNTRFSHKQLAKILGKEPPSFSIENPLPGETYSLEIPDSSPDKFYHILDQLSIEFKQQFLPAYLANTDNLYSVGLAIIDDLVP